MTCPVLANWINALASWAACTGTGTDRRCTGLERLPIVQLLSRKVDCYDLLCHASEPELEHPILVRQDLAAPGFELKSLQRLFRRQC
ncbi:MAG: hypothetical protein K0R38_6253 [Polyangiaceae bacterium]|nr:hypothetical protein [Polyangiaceae bacterium]